MKFRGSEYGFQFETKGAKAVQNLDKVVCIGPQATTKKMAKDSYMGCRQNIVIFARLKFFNRNQTEVF